MEQFNIPDSDKTNKELENSFKENLDSYFEFYRRPNGSSISHNDWLTLAKLAKDELLRRSNKKYTRYSFFLSVVVVFLSVITIVFAYLDYSGDEKWQKKQLNELELLNKNLKKINELEKELKLSLQHNEILEQKLNHLENKLKIE